MRTDLITFNDRNKGQEMPYFAQEIFTQAQAKGPLTDQDYLRALDKNHLLARTQGIDAVMVVVCGAAARIVASGQRALGSTAADFVAAIERQRLRVREIAQIIDVKNPTR